MKENSTSVTRVSVSTNNDQFSPSQAITSGGNRTRDTHLVAK